MRREGRPHGMVRTYHILPAPLNPRPSSSRTLNKLDAPTTAGIFTKLSHKPTNHSKFTGKCEKVRCSGCRLHPACKSKDKSKGTQKLKTSNASVNYQQLTWRVVGLNKMRSYGYSASGILDQLHDHYHDHDDDDDDDNEEHVHGYEYDHYDGIGHDVEQGKSDEIIVDTSHDVHGKSDDNDNGNDNDNDDDEVVIHVGVMDDGDDGYKGFYDVAYVLNPVDEDDDGWSVVG